MYNAKAFGENLRAHLSSHGISQKWVAEQMNTTTATVSRYVSGDRVPGLENLVDLAAALNVSVDYLLGIEQPNLKSRVLPDVAILDECYMLAPMSIRKIIWASLDPYMTPEQRIVVDATISVEERGTSSAS